MLKTIIVLPDGTELSSGPGTVNAIRSVTITECVNDSQELTLGSTCANMLEAKLIAPEGGLSICAGDELTVYKADDSGKRYKVGLFTTELPTRPSANTMSIVAYDRVSWLDKDLGQWLFGLDAWPYSLYIFAQMVCDACGLTLLNEELPNGDYQIQAFSGEGITGRQLMRWVGQVAGRFCRATVDGEIEFACYCPVVTEQIGPQPSETSVVAVTHDEKGNVTITGDDLTVSDDGDGNIVVDSKYLVVTDDGQGNLSLAAKPHTQHFFYANSLRYEDYQVCSIEKVQIQLTDEDIGGIYPDVEQSSNTYVVTGNYLLTAETAQQLEPVAQVLYEHLRNVTYTPCKVTIPSTMAIHAGDIVTVTDKNGKTFTIYVMTKKQAGQKDTLECTGSFRRDSSTATNEVSYKALSGKVLELRAEVEGLRAENRDANGNMASMVLELEGIRTQVKTQESVVSDIKTKMSQVEQTAEDVQIRIASVENDGASKVRTKETGYTFDDEGLKITKADQEMENILDNTGMYVRRLGEVILQANNNGVVATDVTVHNYLVVGNHARFEDYSDGSDGKRTACFWL